MPASINPTAGSTTISGGMGGGGGGGGSGKAEFSFPNVNLTPGGGGTGGSTGGAGGRGGMGGVGGAGGGAFEIVARGAVSIADSGSGGLLARGGAGSPGQPGEPSPQGPLPGYNGGYTQGGNAGGGGGGGGAGANGGTGAPGAGGSGGTVKIVGTTLTATGAKVNISGGQGATSAGITAPNGGVGRVIVGSNTNLTLSGGSVIAIGGAPPSSNITPNPPVSSPVYTTGPTGTNPFIDPSAPINATTPYIAGQISGNGQGLIGGAALDGLISATITRNTLTSAGLTVPGNALAAVQLIDLSKTNPVLSSQYTGYNLLVIANLTSINLANPMVGVVSSSGASTFQIGLQSGGAAEAPVTLTALNANQVWATLVPTSASIAINATVGNISSTTSLAGSISHQTIVLGQTLFLNSQLSAFTMPAISGIAAEAVSPDGHQLYAIDTTDGALVVINADGAAPLSQRQVFNFNTIPALQGATDIAVGPTLASGKQFVFVTESNRHHGVRAQHRVRQSHASRVCRRDLRLYHACGQSGRRLALCRRRERDHAFHGVGQRRADRRSHEPGHQRHHGDRAQPEHGCEFQQRSLRDKQQQQCALPA